MVEVNVLWKTMRKRLKIVIQTRVQLIVKEVGGHSVLVVPLVVVDKRQKLIVYPGMQHMAVKYAGGGMEEP